jgi:hypothetical protein
MEVRPPLDAWKHVSKKIVALELRVTRSLRRTGSPKSATPKPIAEHDDPTMFARIGVIRALNRHVKRVFNPSRKEPHWGRRKLTRDR